MPTVFGVVVDPAGNPVAGAKITAQLVSTVRGPIVGFATASGTQVIGYQDVASEPADGPHSTLGYWEMDLVENALIDHPTGTAWRIAFFSPTHTWGPSSVDIVMDDVGGEISTLIASPFPPSGVGGPDVTGLWLGTNKVERLQHVPIDAPSVDGTVPTYSEIDDEIHWRTPTGGTATPTHLLASSSPFNLGDGFTPDFTALNAFFGAFQKPYPSPSGATAGIDGELPAYQASFTAPDYRSALYLVGPPNAGAFTVRGQGSGASTITIAERIDATGSDGTTDPAANTFSSAHAFTSADIGKFIRSPYVAGGVDQIASISGTAAVMLQPVFPVVIPGFTNAQSWSLTRGCLGHVWVPTSIVRGGGSLQGNVVTASGATPHHLRVGQKVWLRLPSRGMNPAPWACFSVFATPDQFTARWIATSGEVVVNGVGIGQTASGGNLDNLIPPAGTAIFCAEFALEILNEVSASNGTKLDSFALLRGGKPTYSPLDGMGIRWANRSHIADFCRVDGFFLNAVSTATPDVTVVDPAVGTGAVNPTGNVFTSTVPVFDANVHVGALITTPAGTVGVHGTTGTQGGSDTIATVISSTQCTMTKSVVGSGSGLSFTVGWKPQNTDHHWITSKLFTNCTGWQIGWIDNSASSPFRSGPYANKPGLGGGRDEHIHDANFGGTDMIGGFFFNDAGNFESMALTGVVNLKGGSYPLYFQGPDGLDPCEGTGIDGIYTGALKIESPGSKAFIHDESFRRTMWMVPESFELRLESGITINGLDQGTPGGGGTNVNAGAQFGDFTDRPWPVTNVSLLTVGGVGGTPTIQFTGPAAMFGGDGGRDIGTGIAIGGLVRYSGLSGTDGNGSPHTYAKDAETVAGIAGAGLFRSASARFTSDDIGLRVDSQNVAGGSDTILAVNSATEVVMTGAISVTRAADNTIPWVIRNDGTKAQAAAGYHGKVKTVSAPDVNGNVVVTMDHMLYASAANGGVDANGNPFTLPELPGPYVGAAGELGGMSAGMFDEFNPTVLPETESLDTECHHQQFVDCLYLRSSSMRFMIDDVGPSTRKFLPCPRVVSALSWRKINGQTYAGTTATNGLQTLTAGGTLTVHTVGSGFVLSGTLGNAFVVAGNVCSYTGFDGTTFSGIKILSGAGGAISDGSTVTNAAVFSSQRAKFTRTSIGASIAASGTGWPGSTSTIATFVNAGTIITANAASGAATNLTFTVGNTKNLVPFKSELRVGSNRFEIFLHHSADPHAVTAGSVLEFVTGVNNNLAVQCSVNGPSLWAGVAASGSPAGGSTGIIPTCTTSGTVGIPGAKVIYNGPCVLIFSPGDTIDQIDYPVQVLASAAIPAGTEVADNGDITPGQVVRADTKLNPRVIGQAIQAAGGSPLDVPVRLAYSRPPAVIGGGTAP